LEPFGSKTRLRSFLGPCYLLLREAFSDPE
jgi:hypothetical protein